MLTPCPYGPITCYTQAVELEEKINYERRMSKQWVGEVESMVGNLPTAYVHK